MSKPDKLLKHEIDWDLRSSAKSRRDPNTNLEMYRNYCLKAARELQYIPEVIDKIYNAETEAEISNIMKQARMN